MKVAINALACNFCGRSQHDADVVNLIAGPEPYLPAICEKCVQICVEILAGIPPKTEQPL